MTIKCFPSSCLSCLPLQCVDFLGCWIVMHAVSGLRHLAEARCLTVERTPCGGNVQNLAVLFSYA